MTTCYNNGVNAVQRDVYADLEGEGADGRKRLRVGVVVRCVGAPFVRGPTGAGSGAPFWVATVPVQGDVGGAGGPEARPEEVVASLATIPFER